jgi:hypothetical protein
VLIILAYDGLIREAFEEALKWFQKTFKSKFSPSIEIGEYATSADLFRFSLSTVVIQVNRSKLLEYVERMNYCLQKLGKSPNNIQKEMAARFVHEIVETFLTASNEGLKYAIKIFPYFHEYADYVEDLYRDENKLEHHAHSYKILGLEERFKKIRIGKNNL